jgi:hypothetical protein
MASTRQPTRSQPTGQLRAPRDVPPLLILGYAAAVYLLVLAVLGYAIGWVVAIGSTFMIDHFDLLGLRQAYLHARGTPYRPPPFTERALYRRIRHPMMAGFVIVFWAAPTMTTGHLLFAAAAIGYILVGITFEAHDSRRDLGEPYRAYQRRVPALMPALWPRSRRNAPSQGENTA